MPSDFMQKSQGIQFKIAAYLENNTNSKGIQFRLRDRTNGNTADVLTDTDTGTDGQDVDIILD